MSAAGRYITTSNGLTDWYPDEVGVPDGSIGKVANNLPEMVAEVRHQVKNGVDFIKLADSPFGEYQAFTTDELKAIADLAHQLKRGVTIHARGSAEVGAAVEAGLDWIMHGNMMDDEVIDRLAASKIPLVPTLLLLGNMADFGDLVGVPVGGMDGCKRMLEATADSLHRAHKAGVVFAMGTDTGFAVTPYGEWHARELELLMDYAGLSPMEAIVAGTRNAAKTLKLEGQLGQLTVDAYADVVIWAQDPLKDIRVLQDRKNIVAVIKGGARVDLDADDTVRWHHDRAQIYSTEDLTYDVVYGDSREAANMSGRVIELEHDDPESVPIAQAAIPWEPGDGREFASEFKHRREQETLDPD
jgi:imidazolonepropionase-like amidohydrolase